jgi:glycosyltransferase involved in cell wall biosynthesis
LERDKGVEDLLIAARLLKESRLDFELTLVGDGRNRAWVEAFVREHTLDDRVRCLGWQSPEEVRSHLTSNDIFVLPSWGEGMPNALIEAMAARLACVCSRVGMVPDFLRHGTDALLTAPRDSEELGEALRLLIEDAALRHNLADRAFELAEEVFSERLGVRRFADAVEVVLRRPGD